MAARVDFPDPEGPVIPRCSPGSQDEVVERQCRTVGPPQLGTVHHDAVAVGQGQGGGGVADRWRGDGEPVEALAGRTCAHRQRAGVGQPADGSRPGRAAQQQQGEAAGEVAAGSTRAATATTPSPAAALVRAVPAATARAGASYGPGEPCRLLADGVEGTVRRAPLLELAQPVRDLLDPGAEQRAARDDERLRGGGAARASTKRERRPIRRPAARPRPPRARRGR